MIQAVVFDFGNVICKFDNNIFLEKISQFTKKSVEELHELIYCRSCLTQEYETGRISSQEFFEGVSGLCDLEMDRTAFREAFTQIFTPIVSTFELIRNLKSTYKLGLVTNVSEWDFEDGIKPIPVFGLFEATSLSFRVGVLKPDEKIYYDILNKLDLAPEECAYIDDILEFVRAAEKTGLHGIHYTSHGQLIKSLRKLGICAD